MRHALTPGNNWVCLQSILTRKISRRCVFGDEVYFGYGIQDELRIVQKAGKQACAVAKTALKKFHEPTEKGQKNAITVRAAAGHNLKSDIHFFEVPKYKDTREYYRDLR